MRVSHPSVFFVCMAAFAALLVVWAALKSFRALSWPRELRRRRGWAAARARVEESTRVTDIGDFILVLSVSRIEADGNTYRDGESPLKLRGIARLPERAIERMTELQELPVRLDPRAPNQLVVDLPALLGAQADALERAAYMERGRGEWKLLP